MMRDRKYQRDDGAVKVVREEAGERSGGHSPRSRVRTLRARKLRRAGAVMAMLVAGALGVVTGSGIAKHAVAAQPATNSSQQCSARYAALLDLAELARRDGKSSEVVVRGLSDRGGVMSDCFPDVDGQ